MGTKHVSKKETSKIIELSKIKSQKDIAVIFESNQPEISKILRLNGVKRKKSRLNMSHLALDIDYFKKINSSDKAYWLGFICADGNINKNNNKVSLISKDLEVIEGFKESIGAEHAISKRENFDKRTNKTYTGYSIQIGNEIFTNHLINLGVTSNKTDVLEFPDIKEKYYSYFIAGLFDGDGSIIIKGKYKNHLGVNLISTLEVLNYIDNYLENEFGFNFKKSFLVTKNKVNVWKTYLDANGHDFLKFVYQDENFKYYLKRKYDLFLNNINNRQNVRHFRKILQYDKNMNLINSWNSQKEIGEQSEFNKNALNVYLRKGNKRGYYKNYIWKYEDI